MKTSATTEVFIVAGEESANQYARKIIHTCKDSQIKFSGIGFSSLEKQGFNLVYDAEKLAVMGALEVLSKWRVIKEAFEKTLNYLEAHEPQAVLLIDYGGFNLRLAKKIKERKLKTKVYYFISPKIWAWNEKRALKVKKYVDKMFVIHPFEVDFYKKWGVQAEFIGHPLLQDIKKDYFNQEWKKETRKQKGLPAEGRLVATLLGSRKSEIDRHLEPFCETANRLHDEHKRLSFVFIIPPSHKKRDYQVKLQDVNFNFYILQSEEPMENMALCDLALVASGTASLQVGLLGLPMAIGYIMNPVTMFLAKTFVKGVKYAGLVNILSGKELCREFLQNDFQPEEVAKYLSQFLNSENKYKKIQDELLELKKELGKENSYQRLKNELEALY